MYGGPVTTGVSMKLCFGGGEGRLPFQARSRAMGSACGASAFERPEKINQRQQIADAENGRARRREHIENLELRRIGVIAPRHSEIAQHELREERQIESEKSGQCRELSPDSRDTSGR